MPCSGSKGNTISWARPLHGTAPQQTSRQFIHTHCSDDPPDTQPHTLMTGNRTTDHTPSGHGVAEYLMNQNIPIGKETATRKR